MTFMKASESGRMIGSDSLSDDLSMEFPVPEKYEDYLSQPRPCRSLRCGSSLAKTSSAGCRDFSPRASLNQALKESLQNWKWKMKFKGSQDKQKRVLNDRRAALENDVAQLQTQLQDERALRQGLERALDGNVPPCQGVFSNLAPQTQDLIIEIASLEKEVTNLEQHVLSLYRNILDQKQSRRASGKPSDPCNPCSPLAAKDHAAPSRESRFKVENNPEIPVFPPASPQHRRHGSAAAQGYKRPHSAISADRHFKTRHGSLLSGAFYSIDEEPCADQGFSTSMSMDHSRELTPARRFLGFNNKKFLRQGGSVYMRSSFSSSYITDVHMEQVFERNQGLTSVGTSLQPLPHIQVTSIPEQSTEQSLTTDTINESENLEEPSSESPNRLSEELVRCMAAIYCKLADPPLPQTTPTSPSSSSSLNTTASSPHDSWSPRWQTETVPCDTSPGALRDPYMVKACGLDNAAGSYSSMVQVPWICVDKDRFTYAARALRNFRSLVEQLEKVNPAQMSSDQKLAFWINIYNALMMHAYLAYGIPRNRLKRLSLLQKAAYKVGPHSINAQSIEHSILGCRSNRPAQWLQLFLSSGTKFKARDERRTYALDRPEPLVCFALCCGGRSDAAVRVYSAKNVRSELELAKREFLQASIGFRSENKVLLPRILEWYARELVMHSSTLLDWVCQNVPEKLQMCIRQCIQMKPHKSSAHCLEWQPYSFGFRYIFAADLAQRLPASAR